ncbi:MAG TPA: murein biosynthesis integral membrane protein MurJ [Desulfosarcina sp.]|nr:murein biosynthesis integral membrane protein MurJ [Desulfosarcina sp.]
MSRASGADQAGNIGAATLIMMASIFLSRLTGVAREMVLAALAGAGTAVDAYRVAFVLPEILNHILASGFLSVTFIPIFSRYLAEGRDDAGWHTFSNILTIFGAVLAVLIAVGMVLAPVVVPFLAAGRQDPHFIDLAVRMTRITLPAQFFFFAGGVLMAVQYARSRFLFPALAPLIYNLGIIGGGWLLSDRLGVEGFCWGALAGAAVGSFMIQIVGARRAGMRFRPVFDLRHRDLRRYVLLTLPLMIGLTMVFSTELFSKFFGSFLPAGAIAWIDYAMRVMLILVGFFGQAVGVASYPYMARLAVEGRFAELNGVINTVLRYLSVVIPLSILVVVLRHEIVRVLFERGRFTPEDTAMTALTLACLMAGAIAFVSQTVVNRGFYATQNTLLPTVFGTIAVLASLPVYWVGMKLMGVAGVGLAISASALIQTLLLYSVWNRRSGNTGAGGVYRAYLKAILAGPLLGAALWLAHRFLATRLEAATLIADLTVIAAVSGIFVLLTALWGRLFNVESVQFLIGRIAALTSSGSKRPD